MDVWFGCLYLLFLFLLRWLAWPGLSYRLYLSSTLTLGLRAVQPLSTVWISVIGNGERNLDRS